MTAAGIAASVLDLIGSTPIVHLGRLFPGKVEVLAKLELLNPGGSHKVRIAVSMIRDAESRGLLRPGRTILEPTGGNTGVGIAMAAALLGYRAVLVVPDNYSQAKQDLLRAYGAEVVLADHRRGLNCHGERALELQFENPDWVLLNQQANPANPAIHDLTTAAEIKETLGHRPADVLVCGVGTGGHLTGVGRALRKEHPELRIVAAVPEGCSLREGRFAAHDLQGLAVGLVPAVLEPGLISEEIEVSATEAAAMMKRCMRTEGLALGLSSAANLVCVAKLMPALDPGSRVLTFAYDSAGDYLGHLRQPRPE